MSETAIDFRSNYDNTVLFVPAEKTKSAGKNYSFSRTEACNGKVDPIRNEADIKRIAQYFYDRKEYRNWCMFIVGINCGLRVSDMVRWRVDDIANPSINGGYQVKPAGYTFRIVPKKTANKRKYVQIKLTQEACNALQIYLDLVGKPGKEYSTFFKEKGWLFPTTKSSVVGSQRSSEEPKTAGDPIDGDSVGKDFRKCQKNLELPFNFGTHSMRKTFGYRFFRQYQGSDRQQLALATLQSIFNHSSERITLGYIGISDEEIDSMLGSYDCGIDVMDTFGLV